MPFYEVIATVSLTLALAIPTFLEKVMRSGYERRVESYKNGVIEEFREVFVEAFNEFNEVQYLTTEIEDKISEVVSMWEEVQTNYHKLESFIKTRIYLTIGWIIVFSCSISSIYSQSYNVILFNIDWPGLTNLIFGLLLFITIIYIYQLLKFDYDLTQYIETKFHEKLDFRDPMEKKEKYKIETIREYEKKNELIIEKFLKEQNIKFEKDIVINNKRVDFIIPNARSPQIIIELKVRRFERGLPHFIYGSIIALFASLKVDFPNIKTVLITNYDLSKYETRYKDLIKFTDAIVKLEKIEKLGEFIKEINEKQ